MLEQRYLMSAFWFCVAVNVKQITVYYSLAYFFFLLMAYCFTPSFNLKNFLKLGSLVITNIAVVYLPFYKSFDRVYYYLTGGEYHRLLNPISNINSLVSFSEIFIDFKYTKTYLIPVSCKVLLLGVSGLLLAWFMRSKLQEKYFPLFMNISSWAFYHFMDYVHAKHLAYVEFPFLLYALIH